MRHSVLRNHVQKKILLRRNIYRKYISDASNSSDVEVEIIKQTNTLKPLNMEPCKAYPKNPF